MGNILIESLADMFRGILLTFFVMLAISVYPRRKENQVLEALFYMLAGMAVLGFMYLIFIFEGMYENEYMINIGLTLDMCIVPLVGSFFLKIIYPEYINKQTVFYIFLPFILFVILHILTENDKVMTGMFIFTILFVLGSIFLVVRGTSRYQKNLKKNYSDISDISVLWVRNVLFIFIGWYVVWCALVDFNSPLAVIFYYIFMISIWIALYQRTKRHVAAIQEKNALVNAAYREEEARCPELLNGKFAAKLESYMERERPWLIPTLSLNDLAEMHHTNRTYLSEYLNHTLGMSFYDYVNRYRINHACKILLEEPAKTLQQVVDESGFNSLSTFRRTFEKQIGVSPAMYRKQYTN